MFRREPRILPRCGVFPFWQAEPVRRDGAEDGNPSAECLKYPSAPPPGRKAGLFPFCVAAVSDQDFEFNLSTKRRLCNTVGGRFIDGVARCCAVSTARSRAAATTNLARIIHGGVDFLEVSGD